MVETFLLFAQLSDVMNPAAVHTFLQLPTDPVVYWAEARTVGWPRSWSDEVWYFMDQQLYSFHAPYGEKSCPVSRGHFLSSDYKETDIFCCRYLKINNSNVNKYFLTKFYGSFSDISKI